METIQAARQTFLDYINKTNDDESEVIAAIEELDYMEITTDLLSTTGIGKTISALVKDKRSDKINTQAKKLEKKLKSMVSANKSTNKRKRSESNGATTQTKRKTNKSDIKVEKLPQPKKESNTKADTSKQTPVKQELKEKEKEKPTPRDDQGIPIPVKDFLGETSDNVRNTIQTKLWQSLGDCKVQGGIESSRVAVAIENALISNYGDCKNKEYRDKFRSLFSNLKDPLNDGLRNALFTGDLTPERLILMSHEELANPKLQEKRKVLKEYQQEARRGDRHMQEATCTMFVCLKCKQDKTTYYQLQTRSADEPMTTFVTCCTCGNHWKF